MIFIIHHIVCVCLTLCSLAGVALPARSFVFVAAVTALEAGSLVFGLMNTNPKSEAMSRLCAVGMSASNVVAGGLGLWFTLYGGYGGPVERYAFCTVGVMLVAVRQQQEVARWRARREEKRA